MRGFVFFFSFLFFSSILSLSLSSSPFFFFFDNPRLDAIAVVVCGSQHADVLAWQMIVGHSIRTLSTMLLGRVAYACDAMVKRAATMTPPPSPTHTSRREPCLHLVPRGTAGENRQSIACLVRNITRVEGRWNIPAGLGENIHHERRDISRENNPEDSFSKLPLWITRYRV